MCARGMSPRHFWRNSLKSLAFAELRKELERAVKGGSRFAADVQRFLERYGYRLTAQNTHLKFEAKSGCQGLQTITVMKTPSDYRGQKNTKSQIEEILGITTIKGLTQGKPKAR
ncbi:hypothetical protein [Paenirhodobacter sp.]|uniref:hypothetical protein n=1 Tax=Paenirhodobacter sp. TaxID=1965326 RepID=UPI003B41051B